MCGEQAPRISCLNGRHCGQVTDQGGRGPPGMHLTGLPQGVLPPARTLGESAHLRTGSDKAANSRAQPWAPAAHQGCALHPLLPSPANRPQAGAGAHACHAAERDPLATQQVDGQAEGRVLRDTGAGGEACCDAQRAAPAPQHASAQAATLAVLQCIEQRDAAEAALREANRLVLFAQASSR